MNYDNLHKLMISNHMFGYIKNYNIQIYDFENETYRIYLLCKVWNKEFDLIFLFDKREIMDCELVVEVIYKKISKVIESYKESRNFRVENNRIIIDKEF